jgi:hypothetical protein
MSEAPTPPGVWTKRRRRADIIMVFCGISSLGLTIAYPENPLVAAFAMALLALLGSTFGIYAGGAVIDDKFAREHKP